jgi:hypothetical protein
MSNDTPQAAGSNEESRPSDDELSHEETLPEPSGADAPADEGHATSEDEPIDRSAASPDHETLVDDARPAGARTDDSELDDSRPHGTPDDDARADAVPPDAAEAPVDAAAPDATQTGADDDSVRPDAAGSGSGDALDAGSGETDVREPHEAIILPPEPSRPAGTEPETTATGPVTSAAADQDVRDDRDAAATDDARVPEPVPYTATAAAATPMYVTVPTPPKRRGNRLMGILIDVVATVAYAVVFAAVALGLFALREPRTALDLWERYLQTAGFWVPVVVFFLAYALLIAIVNRGGWWAHVLGSFFVGAVVYFGYLGGALLTVQAWTMSLNEANQFVGTLWTNPLTIASAVVAREAALWFGAWIAARGRRVRAANLEAQRDYERRVAAGPTANPVA